MRKVLISIIIVALAAIFILMATSGLHIGNISIASVRQIVANNQNLETELTKLKESTDTSYETAKLDLDSSLATLQDTKKRYNDATTYTTDEEIKNANQEEQYDISYLWTKIGLYAKKNNVTIQLNVSYGTVEGLYNLSILAYGQYLPISEFIYAIEKDTKLGFRIEDFTMTQYSEEQLQASFSIKNVAINKDSLISAGALPKEEENTDEDTNDSQNTNDNTNENVNNNQQLDDQTDTQTLDNNQNTTVDDMNNYSTTED